ncbi:carbohydrate ABC transporter permease, partial [Microbacterium maritypicum]
ETDGAGVLSRFRHVTIPGVRSATTLVLILSIITGANLFTEPYLLTNGGGPDGASTTPVLLIYQLGIQQQNPDTAAAIGMILVILVGMLSLAANRATRER